MGPISKSKPAANGWNGASGTVAEERVSGTVSYLDVLARLHSELRPAHYLEIGVRHGASLALARGVATGIDPAPAIECTLPETTKVVSLTSDDFFTQTQENLAPDLCFIDGLHLCEYALCDLMNIERCAAPGAVVVIDDVYPNHPVQAERDRRTRVWTGDVWRLVEVLRRYRPDLFLLPLDTTPAGLLLIAGLDFANRVLRINYETILCELRNVAAPPPSVLERHEAVDPSDKHFSHLIEILKNAREAGAPPQQIVKQLQKAHAEAHGAPIPKTSQ
jgi:predicted O-methyltransferase YrrM